jgi:hypothetical protein
MTVPDEQLVRIRSRRGSASEWLDANPVLAAGEVGVEVDTGFMKVGDGDHPWDALAYGAGGSPSLVLQNKIHEPDTVVEYDAASSSSVAIYWVFHDGARGQHSPNVRNARLGTMVFFLARNMTAEPQTIGGQGNYWLAPGGAGVQLTTTLGPNDARDSWLAANGAVIQDEQVGVACVLTVTT